MKPRIRKAMALWECLGAGYVGIGYTPQQAYDEWMRMSRGRLERARRMLTFNLGAAH